MTSGIADSMGFDSSGKPDDIGTYLPAVKNRRFLGCALFHLTVVWDCFVETAFRRQASRFYISMSRL
jgi:hypothetical protein